MVVTIISGLVFFGSLITMLVKKSRAWKCNDIDDAIEYFNTQILLAFIAIMMVICTSFIIEEGYKQNYNIEEKNILIEEYNECPCENHLRKMQNYNFKVNWGNNIIFRFDKGEDRSIYLIDIDSIMKGE